MAGLFSFGSDKYGKKKLPGNVVSGKQGTFDGPVQFRPPGTPYKASDLEITPNPYGPKRQEAASKYAKVGGVTIGLKGTPASAPASKPSGFDYSQVAAPKSPASVNTAAVAQAPAMGRAAGGQPTLQAANVPSSPASVGAASVQPQVSNDVIRRTAEQNLQKYRQGVLSAMSPSGQERQLADELAQFQGQARMGISGLEGQGRGIPLGLIRGQQAQLQEQAGIQEQTLLGRLNAAQQARQAELASSQAALGFEEADIAREKARSAAQAAGIKPIEVGGNLIALNPQTGQYEVVYEAPAGGAEGFTLSAGQQRFDAQGRPIAGVEAAPKEFATPATVQEYQFAQSQGFQGSFLEYQKAKEAAGTSGKPPTAAQSLAAGYASRIAEASRTIDQLESKFTGLTSQLGFVPEYFRTENRKLLEQAERNFINAVLRRESGAAIAPSEFENARMQYFPQPGDGAEVLAQKKKNRETVLGSLSAESRGQLPGGDEIDTFLDSFSGDLGKSGNGPIVSVSIGPKSVWVSTEIADRLAAADADFYRATGKHLAVNEGLRSGQRQAELYRAYRSGTGGRAAPPGKSFHETGKAVDIANWKEAEPYLRRYGFKNELADDRNHFSLGEFA